jgi:hypothetical protein
MSEKMAQFVIIPDPLIKVAIISFNVWVLSILFGFEVCDVSLT